jgi:hypothetical protein
MDIQYAENQSQVLSTILAGFNELIRNAYLQGFQDGHEFGIKIQEDEANKLDIENMIDDINEFNPIKARALKEAELILMEYS